RAESTEHGSGRSPAAPLIRGDVPADEARVSEATSPPAAPTAGVRPSRRPLRGGAAPAADVDMRVNPPEDIPTLGRMALTDPDPQRRAAAGVLLAATEKPEAVPLLYRALSDADATVRQTLVKEIAELDFAPDTTIDLLSPVAMKDSESGNRVAALEV